MSIYPNSSLNTDTIRAYYVTQFPIFQFPFTQYLYQSHRHTVKCHSYQPIITIHFTVIPISHESPYTSNSHFTHRRVLQYLAHFSPIHTLNNINTFISIVHTIYSLFTYIFTMHFQQSVKQFNFLITILFHLSCTIHTLHFHARPMT